MANTKLNKILMVLLIIIAAAALLLAIYFLPPVHNRLSYRVSLLRAEIYYFLNPPEKVVFVPSQQDEMSVLIELSPTATEVSPTATTEPSLNPTDFVPPTPTTTTTPTPMPTPIPAAVRLEGAIWEEQLFNNCGPANLSVALSYWGWEGDQTDIAPWLKPLQDDRNVMPYEMVEYVQSQTPFNAILRHGGNFDLLKELIAAGFPVIIEKGYEDEHEFGWMGHYGVLTGYDVNEDVFIMQDTYVKPDYPKPFERIQRGWRAFNYLYIVVYPYARESEVFEILGPRLDETHSFELAAEIAKGEIEQLEGRDLFFAWFNYGTSQRNLLNYYGAAQAFDHAFDEIFFNLPFQDQPYRIMWYQTDPYFAYYYTGRYQDLIELANYVFYRTSVNAIEETWVWRGRARLALGDVDGAVEDFQVALKWHPGWWVAENELSKLGLTP